jgi:DNA-binding MarR family transcriptional regulator
MSTTTGLADLLFGRTRGAVLALLYGRADQSFYTREIAREVGASVGAVQRELKNLSKVGLIVRKSAESDVDLMVIGKTTLEEVLSRLSTAEKSTGRPIHPTV